MKRILILSATIFFNAFAFSQGKVVFQDTNGSDLSDTVELFYEYGMDHITFDCFITNTDTANGYKVRLKRIVKQSVPDATDVLSFGIFLSEFSSTDTIGMTAGGDSIYKDSKVSTTEPWELITLKPDSTNGMAVYEYFIVNETNQPGVFVDMDSVVVKYNLTGVSIFDKKDLSIVSFESYPNPATDRLNISYQILANPNALLNVYNVLGMKMISKALENPTGFQEIMVVDWDSGLYFITLESQGMTLFSKKFIKK